MDNNFNRPENNIEDNPEYQMQKEAMYEKEKSINDFKKKYREIIEAIKVLFVNEQLEEKEIIDIIKSINSNPTLTIFEAMNLIEREVKIIKALQFAKSEQKRQYGPNKDILEPEFEPYFPKNNLRKVIQKYKVYQKDDSETFPDEQWFFIDDFDSLLHLFGRGLVDEPECEAFAVEVAVAEIVQLRVRDDAVGDVDEASFEGAEADAAQADLFDGAFRVADFDPVAYLK
jgi:hypothetical protein